MRKLASLAAAAAACAVTVASAAAGGSPPPFAPAQAQAAATAGVTHAVPGQAQQVSLQTVLAAARQPNASVSGRAPAVAKRTRSLAAALGDVCWYQDGLWAQWGTWPYQQRVTEHRYWCAHGYGGAQYYRVSSAYGGSTLCSHSNEYTELVSGGNGYTWTVVRSGASFACPTDIPWITFHYDRWQKWSCNTWGNCAIVETS